VDNLSSQYPLLSAWLIGQLADSLAQAAAALQTDRPLFLPEQAIPAMAAALLRVRIEDEWDELNQSLRANRCRDGEVRAECEFYDALIARLNQDNASNWNYVLEAHGRTRTLLTDSEAIRRGKPEEGLYYWY